MGQSSLAAGAFLSSQAALVGRSVGWMVGYVGFCSRLSFVCRVFRFLDGQMNKQIQGQRFQSISLFLRYDVCPHVRRLVVDAALALQAAGHQVSKLQTASLAEHSFS